MISILKRILPASRSQINLANDRLKKQNQKLNTILDHLNRIEAISRDAKRDASEAVWAEIFNNCIRSSSWLKDSSFSPGRWAVGFQYLYALYRVLDEGHPKNILELGMGQSTKMIAQYVAENAGVKHIVTEADASWIEFFKENYLLPPATDILQMPYIMEAF